MVPDAVVRMQLAANGEAGRRWLADLPRLVDELREVWSIAELGPAYAGGCVAFVAPAVCANGSRAVLKVSLPDDETECEADALALWNGRGAVQLLDADRGRGAMLLERLEPGTPLAELGDRENAINIACSLLRRLWVPVPEERPFRLATTLAQHYAVTFPTMYLEAGQPFAREILERAVDVCRDLAVSGELLVLANRDFHLGNILAAKREPWLVIDPKPLAGEPAFDAAHLIRSLLSDQIGRREVEELVCRIAGRLELDAQRVAKWVFVRSVENALWTVQTGMGEHRWDVACAEAAGQAFHLI